MCTFFSLFSIFAFLHVSYFGNWHFKFVLLTVSYGVGASDEAYAWAMFLQGNWIFGTLWEWGSCKWKEPNWVIFNLLSHVATKHSIPNFWCVISVHVFSSDIRLKRWTSLKKNHFCFRFSSFEEFWHKKQQTLFVEWIVKSPLNGPQWLGLLK